MSQPFSFSKLTRTAITAAVITASTAFSAVAQDTVTIRFASFVGPTSFLNTKLFGAWFEMLEKESGGKLKVEFLTGGSAAKPTEVFESINAGIIDAGWSSTAYNPGRFDAAGVVELPLLATGSAEASGAMASLFDQGLIGGMENVKVIGMVTADIARLHHSKDIDGLDDFKGAKVRAAGQVLSAMIAKIGGVPVGIPPTAMAESLAKNVVDASANDWFALDGFNLIDVTKTHVDISLGTAAIYLAMNKQSYDNLPDDVKAVIDAHPPSEFAEFWGITLENESNRVKGIVAGLSDHKIIVPTEDQLASWQVAADELIADWVAKTEGGAEVLQAYKDGLEAYRASH
ncbi:MAG: TRAP transporter substrate-binding protein DctP [Marinosulfonomonas sp.]|nr:TRAP transporter substrate-binding protein DctP [Marinosulfonomonas sp.]